MYFISPLFSHISTITMFGLGTFMMMFAKLVSYKKMNDKGTFTNTCTVGDVKRGP